MAKLIMITNVLLILLLSIPTITTSSTTHTFSRKASKETLGLARETQTHLHFYVHDIVTGPEPTPTAYPLNLNTLPSIVNSSTLFGVMAMVDDPLTVGPEFDSKLVGRAQGMYGSASLTGETTLFLVSNFVFTEGEYKGSTLSFNGRNPILADVREWPIVGGTGVFRFARGYAVVKPYSVDTVKLNAVLELDVYVTHYY